MKKAIITLLCIVIIISVGLISIKYYRYYIDKNTYEELVKFKPIIGDIGSEEDKDSINTRESIEKKLFEINSHYKGWISIENTNIDYPFVQGADNEFYLKHDFRNKSSISGSIFVDYRNSIEEDKNIILYGHNMNNKTMFNNIINFKNQDFFNQNNKIIIQLNGHTYNCEVFSVYVQPENQLEFYTTFDEGASEEYTKYLKDIGDRSMYRKEVNLDSDSKIITLITCSYEYNNARTIVHAKLQLVINKET